MRSPVGPPPRKAGPVLCPVWVPPQKSGPVRSPVAPLGRPGPETGTVPGSLTCGNLPLKCRNKKVIGSWLVTVPQLLHNFENSVISNFLVAGTGHCGEIQRMGWAQDAMDKTCSKLQLYALLLISRDISRGTVLWQYPFVLARRRETRRAETHSRAALPHGFT